jgi:hypothetical protein
MYRYAVTNTQLFNQLLELEYTQKDLTLVHRSYQLARLLFSGQITSSGKTALSHCVRTASILAVFHAPAHLVGAGLIHNAYRRGDFGDGGHRISKGRRDFVKENLGQALEQEVANFSTLKWNEKTLSNFISGKGPLTYCLVFLRLADILEHNLDGGVLYERAFVSNKTYHIKRITPMVIQAGQAIGLPSLAEQLERVKRENDYPQPFEELHQKFSFRRELALVPPFYSPKIYVQLLRIISRYWPGSWKPSHQ